MEQALLMAAGGLWGGVWWRLRGGALTAITGFDPGTGGMRAIAAAAMALPLALVHWQYAGMFVVLWLVWSTAGWGAFQRMGIGEVTPEVKNPIARVLAGWGLLGLEIDIPGMALEGIWCTGGITLGMLLCVWELPTFLMVGVAVLCGVMFSVLYLIADRVITLPPTGRFAQGQEWSEVLVGVNVGLMMAWEASVL